MRVPPVLKYKAPPFEASLLSNRQRSNHPVVLIADVTDMAPPNAASFERNDVLTMSTSVGSVNDMAPPSRTAVFSTKYISPTTSTFGLKEENMAPEKRETWDSVLMFPGRQIILGVPMMYITFLAQKSFAQSQGLNLNRMHVLQPRAWGYTYQRDNMCKQITSDVQCNERFPAGVIRH